MKISNASQYMLKYQKAKAKLVEYGVKEDDYPHFRLNSNELSFTTIYIISRYVESVIDNDSATQVEFYPDLVIASQYFDAAVNAKDREMHSIDFLLSGATAYFLSDDFGSSKVLCSKITERFRNETPQALLLALFRYILLNYNFPVSVHQSNYKTILDYIKGYFETGTINNDFYDILTSYRNEVYQQDLPLDIYYVDILIAVITETIEKSSWKLLPRYTDLDNNVWTTYLQKSNSIKMLWPSQQLIGEKGVLLGNNSIVQLPTGVGKTKSIELIIRSAFLSNRADTAIIVAPLRALCNEITSDLTRVFESDVIINQFSDVLQEDFLFNLDDLLKKRIIICTPEKLSYIMHHKIDILSEIDLYIFDEAHMFDDGSRGAAYEFLVSEIRNQISDKKQIVLLSAVLSNADQIKEWIFGDSGTIATSDKIKPTPKSIGFSSRSKEIYYFTDDANEFDYYIPKSIETYKLRMLGKERTQRYFPVLTDAKDIAIYYAIRLCHSGGVAIYVNRTDSVNTVIKRILEIVNRGYNISAVASETNMEEAEKIHNLIASYYGNDHEFAIASKLGVFPHYADLPNGIRIAIEYAIRHNKVRFVVCTTTLAQGVNIPIKYLFITSFRASRDSMQIRSFQNLVGRTARSGMYTEGSIVVTDTKFYDERNDKRHGGNYRWNDCIGMFNPSQAEPCGSSILSITQSFPVDYEISISGKKFAEYIITNYFDPECFPNLIRKISDWYQTKKPSSSSNNIFYEIMLRKNIIESIENHLCFVYSSNNENDYEEQSKLICQQTLAYWFGTDEEKSLLIQLFSVIAKKIKAYGNIEQIQNFARTMIGIDLSQKIADWLIDKEITKVFYSEEQLLDMIVTFFYETHTVKPTLKEFDLICKSWIDGKMYYEIKKDATNQIRINEIEDVCSKTISYHLSFFIGNIIDMLAIDSDDENTVNPYFTLCILQKKIKYGVATETAISVCEVLFNDRYLANKLSDIIGDVSIEGNDIIGIIKGMLNYIKIFLKPFPSYYAEKIRTLIE